MAILINFKICDNSPECSWANICPNKALYFDEEKDSLAINNDACINCNSCVKSCPVWAISLARNQQEYETIQKEIENDPRTSKDLFIDRYWAVPISSKNLLKSDEFKEKVLQSEKLIVLEILDDDSIECLIKSLPIKEILPANVLYYKFFADPIFLKQYEIQSLPTLLFFNAWKVIGKIEWFYGIERKTELLKKIDEIINIR